MTKHQKYFLKQKLIGVAAIVASIMVGLIDPELMVSAIFAVPLGLYLIFTKEMVLLDDYFWEVESEQDEEL